MLQKIIIKFLEEKTRVKKTLTNIKIESFQVLANIGLYEGAPFSVVSILTRI